MCVFEDTKFYLKSYNIVKCSIYSWKAVYASKTGYVMWKCGIAGFLCLREKRWFVCVKSEGEEKKLDT